MFKQWNRVNQPSSNQNHREWPRGRRWQPVNMVMEISIDSGKFSASNTNGGFSMDFLQIHVRILQI